MMLKWSALSALLLLGVASAASNNGCDTYKCNGSPADCNFDYKETNQCGSNTFCRAKKPEAGCGTNGQSCTLTCEEDSSKTITITTFSNGQVTIGGASYTTVFNIKGGNGFCPGSGYTPIDGQGNVKGVSHIDLCLAPVPTPTPTPPGEPDAPTPAPAATPEPTPQPSGGGTGGDPWVEGLAGQRYNFDPHVTEDAWFAAVSEPSLQVNLKLHSYNWANPNDAAREFYTGVSVQYFDEDGFAEQSLLVEVRDGDNFDAACSDLDPEAPEHCLGGGGIDVFVNGVRMLEGGSVETGPGFMLAASNVVTACHAIFESQIRAHPIHGQQARDLTAFDFESYLVDRAVRHPAACDRWIAAAKRNFGGIYAAPGVQSSILFSGPRLTSVIEFDKHLPAANRQEPKTYRIGYLMPHYQAHGEISEGFIGESARVRYGADKQPLMSGHVLKGDYADYRVDGPFGREFKAKHIIG